VFVDLIPDITPQNINKNADVVTKSANSNTMVVTATSCNTAIVAISCSGPLKIINKNEMPISIYRLRFFGWRIDSLINRTAAGKKTVRLKTIIRVATREFWSQSAIPLWTIGWLNRYKFNAVKTAPNARYTLNKTLLLNEGFAINHVTLDRYPNPIYAKM